MLESKNTLCTIFAVVCLLGTASSALFSSDPNCFFQDLDGNCLTSGLLGLTGQITSMNPLQMDISQKKTSTTTVPQSQGKPKTTWIQTLLRVDYLRDQQFSKINQKLKKQYNLTDYNVDQVQRSTDGPQNYEITYNYKIDSIIFKVSIEKDNIQVLQKSEIKLEQSTAPWRTLSKEQYQKSYSFTLIDATIRKKYDLTGFNVVEVKRLPVNGYIHQIAYTNGLNTQRGTIYIFSVYITIDRQVQIRNVAQSLSRIDEFRQIEAKLRKQYNLTGFFVAKVRYGFTVTSNYDIAYVNQIGDIYIFSASYFGQDEIKIPRIEKFHVKPQDKYSTDQKFLKIDAKLRKQNNLVGFTVTDVKYQHRQSGSFYPIIYKNSNGDTYTFGVNYYRQGFIHVLSKSMKRTTQINEPPNPFKLDQPLVGNMDSIINSKSFQACLKVLIQNNPSFASPSFESINMNQTSSLTTYKVVFRTKMGRCSAILIYNNATGEATVQSVVSQDVSGFPV